MNLINDFQEILKNNNIKAYIIPTSDYHQSEYVSSFFKARAYLSGFTGSAGTLIITTSDARLWTDGRYFIQAANELEGSGISLMKMGTPGTPTILEYLNSIIGPNDTLAFDGRLINTADYLCYKENIKGSIKIDLDLINEIWTDRPSLPHEMLYELEQIFAGETYQSKLGKIIDSLHKNGLDSLCLTSLEDQAWLYNLRGNDVAYTPVFLAFTFIIDSDVHLFIDNKKINENVHHLLNHYGVKLHDYDDVYSYAKNLNGKNILIDKNKVNALLYTLLTSHNNLVFKENPTLLLKAIKNEVEIKNTKFAHVLDGVAVTKFMKWVKEVVLNKEITEHDAESYLEELRRSRRELIDLSFSTICAYKENAAMMHYNALNGKNTTLKDEGMILVDSGGHYLYGTTDITRTISLGHPTKEEKLYFTTVLKSVIDLADTVFLKGCNGQNLDIKARAPIWKMLIDYKCGTGHGVGHILSVHEAPNGFRWQIVKERNDSAPLLPGMITTDEPGIYLEGKLGIRTENELLCKEVETNEWGTFYGFETITYAPIDLDLIDANLLTQDEKHWLNDYHKMVFENLSPYLDDNTKKWLKKYTKAI